MSARVSMACTTRVDGGVEGVDPFAYLVHDVDLPLARYHWASVPIAKPGGQRQCACWNDGWARGLCSSERAGLYRPTPTAGLG